MFDSLKDDDSPVKKTVAKRKLGPKPSSAKRTKVVISDSDDSDDIKVFTTTFNHLKLYLNVMYFCLQVTKKKKNNISSDEDFSDSDFN